ncbi:MAG: DNA-deoxyinosine glycosylase [Candidatus Accumulibacter sp.]|jgi:hypoxanthine-DNA glycosylase|nr:DNA-deoxyinosine glycosylase [Accumulibacter sp.]
MLTGLPPILDARIETLILGSFPSPASLAARHYYAHRQNQFWRVMAEVLGEPLAGFDYAEKQRCLLRHGVGVWDVYRACRREGALDSAIEAAERNDFSRLAGEAPRLRRVFFNGQTAGRFAGWFAAQGYETRILPSTSPAYTLAFARKAAAWRAAWEGAPHSGAGEKAVKRNSHGEKQR